MTGAEAASPYSTGGGGVHLEHVYAASLLAALLVGDPISELGDNVLPLGIRLQASDISAVDDVVVEGRTPDGDTRRVSIGVRRNPSLVTSEEESVPLVRAFLRVVTENWEAVKAGRWRVALAVGVSSNAARDTAELAWIAQSVRSAAEFREAIDRPKATKERVRTKLGHLDALVALAAEGRGFGVANDELTWRWLSALRVRELRLEGADTADRTAAVTALRRAVADEQTATADIVFGRLTELAGDWAPVGARVDQALLRRALSGFPLARSATYAEAWSVLDGLGRRLREGVRPNLVAGDVELELERGDERDRLRTRMVQAGTDATALVVTGEPDVGKTALTLRVAEHLQREQNAVVVTLSLRDLPVSVVDVEQRLGASIPDVLTAIAVRRVRLLVVDGAEAVLEGRRDLLREFTTAAIRAGVGVVAVTRTDGSTRVRDVLQSATAAAGAAAAPVEHVVGRLMSQERQALVDTFHELIRLSADAHAEWLVGRPGLVDVLLQAGTVVESAEILSEADVFVAVWNGLIRNHEERSTDGAAPGDREEVMLTVARRVLGVPDGRPPNGAVVAGLRSDGVLRAPANPAFAVGEEFATDLIRDFALCRLFLTDGWEPLRTGGAPRWTIRAVRLACQATLLVNDRVAAWQRLREVFAELADAEGERWAEVPVEALLTLGDAQAAIEAVWNDLLANEQADLKTLLRLAQQRYVHSTFGDPYALAPVVAATFFTDEDLGQHDSYGGSRRSVPATIRALILAWLRGMIQAGCGPDPLRQQVRDQILIAAPDAFDEFAIEALATLGPDIDEPTEQWLRNVATDRPNRLHPTVENIGPILSLAKANPQLLLDLAEAYYIEQPDPDDMWCGGGLRDNGIRDLHHGSGFGVPFAAWHFGPFYSLLRAAPTEAIAMINRMLDHAVTARVANARRRRRCNVDDPDEDADSLTLDIPGIGARRYCGDDQVWSWYRGSTVGPYPCISALLAVEKFADELINQLQIPVARVVQLLLRDCHNLAMPGLAVGLLVRHRDKTGDLLDPWLTYPHVWSMEHRRITSEHWHVQGSDDDDVPGRERRGLTPRDVGAEMTLRAMSAGDQARLDALAAVADQLLANARADLDDEADPGDWLVVVESWASVFRPDNYHVRHAPDGTLVVQYEPPEQVATALAPTTEQFNVSSEALRLQMTYSDRNSNREDWPTETLLADIALAQRLVADPPAYGPLRPEDPVTAVAAAAIVSHATGRITVADNDLQWAADTVLDAARHPYIDATSYEGTIYPMAADRAAAKSVPSLLLGPFDHLNLDTARISEALTALASSLYDEVRTAFVTGCDQVWMAECKPDSSGICRRHPPAWDSAQASLATCRLGPWNQQAQRRILEPIAPPYAETITRVRAEDLLVDRLAMPIACAAAARKADCVHDDAASLLSSLLDAHRRGYDHWMREDYAGYSDPQRELVGRVLINMTVNGEPNALVEHLQTFTGNAHALQELLRDLTLLFTYDDDLRPALPDVWPLVLQTVLDTIDSGTDLFSDHHWGDYVLGSLIPTPQIGTADTNPDETLGRARAEWIDPAALDGLADRWITLAAGEPKAADAVTQFAQTTPISWQTTTALTWLERVIDKRYGEFADRCWFVTNWLAELRETTTLSPSTLARWRRIVDGLAGAGDARAVDLQRIDE